MTEKNRSMKKSSSFTFIIDEYFFAYLNRFSFPINKFDFLMDFLKLPNRSLNALFWFLELKAIFFLTNFNTFPTSEVRQEVITTKPSRKPNGKSQKPKCDNMLSCRCFLVALRCVALFFVCVCIIACLVLIIVFVLCYCFHPFYTY